MPKSHHRHLFFDMDNTLSPARQPLLPEMRELLLSLDQTITIVSGSLVEQIAFQTSDLPAYYLGVNGNHATDIENNELWRNPDLDEKHKKEIAAHIDAIIALLDHDLNPEWHPIEDRGAQITFSPIGNRAPVEHKKVYDPDRKKREAWLQAVPFYSEDIVVKIGGSTSFDYIHKDRHKGVNVARLIKELDLDPAECVYFGDGLYPGGNDETVIGVIDTVPVTSHIDTFEKLLRTYAN